MPRKPPEYVLTVLRALTARGFEAFLVGGCARDILMNRVPKDWDVCTNALPEDVLAAFRKCIPTGIKHGTVTVMSRSRGVEVTTYRADGGYADHRRPDSVEFISDLRADLARRDFTMNAIAMSADGTIFDPFGGSADISARIIRCVGNPDERFNEDALRMLRALRFSAVLGFEIEAKTRDAITRNAHLLKHVAAERVCAELNKALLSDRPETAAVMLDLYGATGVADGQRPPLQVREVSRIRRLPKRLPARWAALCAVLNASDVRGLLTALRLDSRTIKCASDGVLAERELNSALMVEHQDCNNHRSTKRIVCGDTPLKRLIAKYGDESALCAASAHYALHGGGVMRLFRDVLNSGAPCRVSELAISGDTLLALGFKGADVGRALGALLDHVIQNPHDNKPEILADLARKM